MWNEKSISYKIIIEMKREKKLSLGFLFIFKKHKVID
jgi:hypothetical protein